MARQKHGTLTAGVVSSVTLSNSIMQITVINRSQTGEIYFTVDGSTPTVGGDDCFVSLGARVLPAPGWPNATPTVKMISNGALDYSIEGETS